MNTKKPNDDANPEDVNPEDSAFDLAAPTRELGALPPISEESKPSASHSISEAVVDPRQVTDRQQANPWRGLGDDDGGEEPEFELKKRDVEQDELDMTPMVDVTFLLLIFFMITASFTTQKIIQQDVSQSNLPSTNVEEREDEDQFVEVIIDQFNTYRLTSKEVEEVEAPSDQEMRKQLKDMIEATRAKKVLITAHGEATHGKVVTAWDAAVSNNIDNIEIQLSEIDY